MEYINKCVICEKEFTDTKEFKLCHECRLDDHHVFSVIRNYIYDFPGATINQVTEALGFPSNVILRYLREGRLQTVGSMKVLNCEKCGVPISFGSLCETCKSTENRAFTSFGKKNIGTSDRKMYTSQKKK